MPVCLCFTPHTLCFTYTLQARAQLGALVESMDGQVSAAAGGADGDVPAAAAPSAGQLRAWLRASGFEGYSLQVGWRDDRFWVGAGWGHGEMAEHELLCRTTPTDTTSNQARCLTVTPASWH